VPRIFSWFGFGWRGLAALLVNEALKTL